MGIIFKDCGCGCDGKKQQEKFITSLISGLTFFVIANPETFRLVRRVLGPGIATPTGCPSTMGLLVHSVVFILVVWAMMNVKKDSVPLAKKGSGGCGCGDKKDVVKPVRQADVTMKPGMVDEPFVDTGLQLGSMDLGEPISM
jgi:hypothetical protein|tara:strand:- start:87 stop:512 length:426 start_codon:yes stop_codon:yes gene_type:complete